MLTERLTLVSNFFLLPVKTQCDSISFDIAESECDSQIALSPIKVEEKEFN